MLISVVLLLAALLMLALLLLCGVGVVHLMIDAWREWGW